MDRGVAPPPKAPPPGPGAVWAVAAASFLIFAAGCPSERPPDYFRAPTVAPALDAMPSARPAAGDASSRSDAPSPEDDDGQASASDIEAPVIVGPPAPISSEGPGDVVPSFVRLFRELSPSVVNIYTQEVLNRRPLGQPLVDIEQGTSLGSGMVLDVHGHILTNAHVVENAAEIRVRFYGDDELPARLVGIDPVRDLALLRVDGAPALRPVVPGDADDLAVGEWVIAIGNPFGLSHTMTKGIVSGKGRAEIVSDRLGYLDLIQTDAAINTGSSGGPLFDMRGRVVGVNTAINAEAQGIAFAIPWSAVEEALPRLLQGGQVSRSWLGVYILPSDPGQPGVLVDAVVEDSPAARAGLLPGDLIVELDERPVKDLAEFRLRVASAVANRDVAIGVARGGARLQLVARLEEARDIR